MPLDRNTPEGGSIESNRNHEPWWQSALEWARIPLMPLASLRLTVTLLALAVFVILVATLEQTTDDIWTVKHRHYSQVFVTVPVQLFFPPDWFPSWQNVPYQLVIPSGLTVLVAMIINLIAAHLVRMRVQASGRRLAAGLITLLAATAACWLVVFGAQNPSGFQGQPPISYHTMWQLMQVAMLGLSVGGLVWCTYIERERQIERLVLAVASFSVLAASAVMLVLGEKTFIGESGMRVLWQLLQSSIGALLLLGACLLLFKRKGGIVLIHLGIGLLMANELYVTLTNVEQQIQLVEGQTAWHAIDIRETEMVVADMRNDAQCRVVMVPGRQLLQRGRITDPRLPFDIELIEYYGNSVVEALRPGQPSLATKGIGLRLAAREIAPFTSDDKKVNFASAYVKIWKRGSDQSLGVYLISQEFQSRFTETVEVDGIPFQMGLRFRHYYKPYSVKLVDAQRELYLGTERPRWFASEILINDPAAGLVDHPQRVWMNNPLRFRDETFYQTSWDIVTTEDGPRELSVLQVVKNRGWMIPYLACMIVVVGLVAQFGSVLLSYLQKRRKSLAKLSPAATKHTGQASLLTPTSEQEPRSLASWMVAAGAAIVCLIYLGMAWTKGPQTALVKDGMNLTEWGQLPVNYGARVQPLDSLARNTVRQLSHYELVRDKYDQKQPALRWLADWIYQAPGHDEYELIRLTDLNVIDALGLPRKKGFRYSMAELKDAIPRLNELTEPLSDRNESELTSEQMHLIDLRVKINRLAALRRALADPFAPVNGREPVRLLEFASVLAREDHLPRVIPSSDDPDQPWNVLSHVWIQRRFAELATELGTSDISKLVALIADQDILGPLREQMIREGMVDQILRDPEALDLIRGLTGKDQAADLRPFLLSRWDIFPKSLYDQLAPEVIPPIDQLLDSKRDEFLAEVEKLVRGPTGWTQSEIPAFEWPYAEAFMAMGPAYASKDATAFNESVAECRKILDAEGAVEYRPYRLITEMNFNGFAPLYQATSLYILALALTALGWAFWGPVWNRAATTVLILALAVHVVGIVMRVLISGRPPVTTLYSSFVFVPVITVSLLLIIERLTRMGVANFLGGLSGAAALLWAWSITVSDQNSTGDTFTVMEAVLDTQFWLSTHVLMVLVGYGGTVLAGMLGAAYLVLSVGSKNFRGARESQLASVIYGVICFALLFSFWGTVLGGLWADDSWGRFWGWDPKENGALMIVLWNAVGLHARWGGLVRHRGLAVLAVLGSIVTIWSWEGVNQLGQGLHAYGFSKDRLVGVGIFVALNLAFASLALIPEKYWRSRKQLT